MENYQCDSNCEIHYGREGRGSYYHHNNGKGSGNCGCNSCRCETMYNSNNTCSSYSCCNTDPIEGAKKLLENAFFEALKEVHVDKIKKIIERDWGNNIEKAAELTVKTIEKQWQTSLSASYPNKEFYEELKKIMTSGNK